MGISSLPTRFWHFDLHTVAAVAATWLVVIGIVFSNGIGMMETAAFVAFSIAWGCVWVVRIHLHGVARRRDKVVARSEWHDFAARSTEPLAWLLAVMLIIMDGFMMPRFWLSSSALDAYAAEVLAGDPRGRFMEGAFPPRQVGLFPILHTEVPDDSTVFITTNYSLSTFQGFVFTLRDQPPVLGGNHYGRISQSWYRWYVDWD